MKAQSVNHKNAKQLLTPASGFLSGYSHSLNPYAGCAFACSYCYVRQLPVALFRNEEWGKWVDVKQNGAAILKKELVKAKKRGTVTIFMSSATDPYQPLEYQERITRSLLEVMVEEQPDFLFVQTRSPLVTRDVDLFQQLAGRIRVSITIETDLEEIRKAFTPFAPPIQARINAIKRIREAGIPVQATVAPLLPSSEAFARKLAALADRICIDDYFMGDGSGGRRTEKLGIRELYKELNLEKWYRREAIQDFIQQLRHECYDGQIYISQAGFMP